MQCVRRPPLQLGGRQFECTSSGVLFSACLDDVIVVGAAASVDPSFAGTCEFLGSAEQMVDFTRGGTVVLGGSVNALVVDPVLDSVVDSGFFSVTDSVVGIEDD